MKDALSPTPTLGRADYLEALREILAALEDNDDVLFEQKLGMLIRRREEGLFVNLARITRELHTAVRELHFDTQLSQLASDGIPDACVRLEYVAQLTEDAAHRTLDLVDQSRTLTHQVSAAGISLGHVVTQLPEGAATISVELNRIQGEISDCAIGLSEKLSALSQTQEYQDLTGQVIKRVTKLVRDVESALISLLRATGTGANAGTTTAPATVGLQGPAVPGAVVGASQEDADALLASLGF